MSAIPYRLSGDLTQVFNLPYQVYASLLGFLLAGDGLGFFIQFFCPESESGSLSPAVTYFVAKHICLRTLPFCKVCEFIRISDIINGLPTLGISGTPFKESSVKRILAQLTKEQVLVKLQLSRSKAVTPLYGLNVPILLQFLDVWWENAIRDKDLSEKYLDGLTRSVWSRRNQNVLKSLCEYFKQFESIFELMFSQKSVISNFNAFLCGLQKRHPKKTEIFIDGYEIINRLKIASRIRRNDIIPRKFQDS